MTLGSIVYVKFSTWGVQIARVIDRPRPDGRIPVVKWRMQGRRWTGRTLVTPQEISGIALPEDTLYRRAERQGAFAESTPTTKARDA
jgi:hypothetical protein